MGVAIAQAALNRYRGDGTNLFQNLSLVEQSQFAALLCANNSFGAGPSGVRSGEEEVSQRSPSGRS